MGEKIPDLGDLVPHLGEKIPNLGNLVPHLEETILHLGESSPNWGKKPPSNASPSMPANVFNLSDNKSEIECKK